MLRTITVTLAATIAVALAACGTGQDTTTSNVTPERAKTTVERAAQLKLTPKPIPDDAREQGLQAAYGNTATAVKDKQLVALFVMNNADVADQLSDMVHSSAPKSARLIINDTVIVVYAAAGSDHATAVENAINAL